MCSSSLLSSVIFNVLSQIQQHPHFLRLLKRDGSSEQVLVTFSRSSCSAADKKGEQHCRQDHWLLPTILGTVHATWADLQPSSKTVFF